METFVPWVLVKRGVKKRSSLCRTRHRNPFPRPSRRAKRWGAARDTALMREFGRLVTSAVVPFPFGGMYSVQDCCLPN